MPRLIQWYVLELQPITCATVRILVLCFSFFQKNLTNCYQRKLSIRRSVKVLIGLCKDFHFPSNQLVIYELITLDGHLSLIVCELHQCYQHSLSVLHLKNRKHMFLLFKLLWHIATRTLQNGVNWYFVFFIFHLSKESEFSSKVKNEHAHVMMRV